MRERRIGGALAGDPVAGTRRGHARGILPRRRARADRGARAFEAIEPERVIEGPAIIESPFTTVVVNPGATAQRRASGSLSLDPGSGSRRHRHEPDRAAAQRDGVRLAILNNRLESVARKMANTLLRTGRSGVLNIARDFSCCIVTPRRPVAGDGREPADPRAVGPGPDGARR